MKLPVLLVVGIVVVAVAATWYISKHYNLSKLSSNTGVPKETIVAAVEGK